MIKYSEFLKNKYGERVYKIPINTGGTCPNRDGKKGIGGCIFCGETGTDFELLPKEMEIEKQIEKNIEFIRKKYKANKYLIYFQNYTATYLPINDFKRYLKIAENTENAVGVSISTRPDCLDGGHLEELKTLKKDVYIELGLQSANDETLEKINRCHTTADFISGAKKVKDYGFYLDIHLILNLPFDKNEDIMKMAEIINEVKPDSIKIHSLHIPYKTRLYDMYINNEFKIISKEEYFERLDILLSNIDKNIAIQRLFSRAPKEDTAFCNWNTSWWKLEEEYLSKQRWYKKIKFVIK